MTLPLASLLINKHQLSIIISGGLLAGLPDKIEKSWILSDVDLNYFVDMYSKTGFR